MPLYEYQCEQCAHRFEVIQKFSDAPIATCPECGGPVQKLLSSPAIQFKGSGFYLTDYGRGNSPKETKGAGEKTAKAEGGSAGDSAPAAAAETKTGDAKPAPAAKSD